MLDAWEEVEGREERESVPELTPVPGILCVRDTAGEMEEEREGREERVSEGDRDCVREERGEKEMAALPDALLLTE